jgi:hypothetical protein
MQNTNTAARMIASACFAGLLALSAAAAEPAAETGGKAAAPDLSVTPAMPTVLPNQPQVGDTAPLAPTVAPNAPKVGDTSPDSSAPAAEEASTKGSPDWPCVQRKVAELTSAQIWDGPPVDEVKGWESDDKIRELTTYLQSRRVAIEDAEKAIKEYAQSQPEGERDTKLTGLFASVLAKINTDRKFVMQRIEQFQRRQKARADEIEREGQKLASMDQNIPAEEQLGPRDTKLTAEQQEYNWNARIFQDRQQNLTMACEIPTLIEQRAYEVAKLIRAEMKN